MAKNKKAKRYTEAEKKEILDFIDSQGRGGQTKAVKKFKVTAATIGVWRKKLNGPVVAGSGSDELQALQELTKLRAKIENTRNSLADLKERYTEVKADFLAL